MRTPQTLKALLFSALVATATLGTGASAAQVYFENEDSGSVQTVDVYVDGTLTFDNVSTGSFMASSVTLGGGTHEVVVTAADQAPGVQDLLRETVSIDSSSTYTLALNWALPTDDTATSGLRQYSLDLALGTGSAD